MTSALRPYLDWLATYRKGMRPRLLNRATGANYADYQPFWKFRASMGAQLGNARRFICPVETVITGHATEIAYPDTYVERNPHLPFPFIYLQVEISARDDETGEPREPLWVLYMLRETGPHTFEGMYGAYEPTTRDVYEKGYRLSYSPDGCEHQPLGPQVDGELPEDSTTRLMMLLPLLAIDDINNPESRQEHHEGRSMIGKSGVRTGEKIEYARLIDLRNGGGTSEGSGAGDGTKKRDHGVRGHWRHLKHGRVIWVRSHRRGDAELGTVDSEYLAPTETVTANTEKLDVKA